MDKIIKNDNNYLKSVIWLYRWFLSGSLVGLFIFDYLVIILMGSDHYLLFLRFRYIHLIIVELFRINT